MQDQILEKLNELDDKFDRLGEKLAAVHVDVAVIKGKDFDGRIKVLEGTAGAHAERITRTEVRSGFIGAAVAAIVAYFTGGQSS